MGLLLWYAIKTVIFEHKSHQEKHRKTMLFLMAFEMIFSHKRNLIPAVWKQLFCRVAGIAGAFGVPNAPALGGTAPL
jgi:hypothetical protein